MSEGFVNVGAHGSTINVKIDGTKLVIEIPLDQKYEKIEKKNPNTINIATVGKPVRVHPEFPIYMGLSVYSYKQNK